MPGARRARVHVSVDVSVSVLVSTDGLVRKRAYAREREPAVPPVTPAKAGA